MLSSSLHDRGFHKLFYINYVHVYIWFPRFRVAATAVKKRSSCHKTMHIFFSRRQLHATAASWKQVLDEEGAGSSKKFWDDANTKIFITEFKKNYELWRTGQISKKKNMWENITRDLNAKGYLFTVEQVQNRYKTLRRGFKRQHIGLSSRNERVFPYTSELTDIFSSNTRPASNLVTALFQDDSSNGEEEERIEYEDVDEEMQPVKTPPKRNMNSRVTYGIQKRKPVKTSVEVLLEIKELLKKVEIRRQVRHEQNVKLANERNEILRRKNELLEQILLKDM